MRRYARHRWMIGLLAMTGALALQAQPTDNDPAAALEPRDRASEPGERVWLDLAEGQALAFYRPDSTGETRGGVVLIADSGRHPATRGSINTLRHTLAQHHWSTLALTPGERDADGMRLLIDAALTFFRDEGIARIVLLGRGSGAVHALHYSADNPGAVSGLVMLEAEPSVPGLEGDSMAPLADLSLPVLDAYPSDDYRALQQARQRRRLTGDNAPYYPTRIPTVAIHRPDQPNRVSQRVRGWLDKHVAGITHTNGRASTPP